MPDTGPQGQRPSEPAEPVTAAAPTSPSAPAPSPALVRAQKFNAANMVRSLLPLTVIVLVLVGFAALRQNGADPVRTVDTGSTVELAAARASYPLQVPQDLPEDWRATSARTDAGNADQSGDPVTLEIGWVTPGEEFAGYVVSDDPRADALTGPLAGATEDGTADIAGATWDALTTERGERAYTRTDGEVTLLVTGSAPDDDLQTLAGAVAPLEPAA